MKKRIIPPLLICLMLTLLSVPALGIEHSAADSLPDLSDPMALIPFEVRHDKDNAEIRKLYDLRPGESPAKINTSSFEKAGYLYECTEILKQDIPNVNRREYTDVYTTESKKNDMETVLTLLPQTREVRTEDGLFGILTLDISSVKVNVSGYGTSNQTVTATRNYPNLSDADMSFIPKTTEENGRTLELSDVRWQTDNTANVDDYEITNRYTAIVTYSTIVTGSYVKGYTVTADYKGEISREDIANVRYTVVFTGTPIEPPVPAPTPEPPPSAEEPQSSNIPIMAYLFIPFIVLSLAGGATAGYYLRKKKETKKSHETDEEN